MKNLISLMKNSLIISLIASCSSLKSSANLSSTTLPNGATQTQIQQPEIPFNREGAFYKLRRNPEGKILPSYQWKECTKKILICVKWETRTVYFENLGWFMANGFGLMKRPKP